MRIAIFFDGKNFHSGYRAVAEGQTIDFIRLSRWLVQRVEGQRLWGAYYYTGIETDQAGSCDSQQALAKFLDNLELLPGFFVYRFPRKARQRRCEKCGEIDRYSQEKEVDTTMVADMLRLAAVNAFDAAILVSGDSDHVPAVEGVRAIGKQVYVATWGKERLPPRIRKAAFDHIDLKEGLAFFAVKPKSPASDEAPEAPATATPIVAPIPGRTAGGTACDASGPEPAAPAMEPVTPTATAAQAAQPAATADDPGDNAESVFLQELALAENRLKNGYVGANYFLKRWKSRRLLPDFQVRNRLLQKLQETAQVELYEAPDGNKAIRIRRQ